MVAAEHEDPRNFGDRSVVYLTSGYDLTRAIRKENKGDTTN
jgi:hypothetical protein